MMTVSILVSMAEIIIGLAQVLALMFNFRINVLETVQVI